MPGLRKQLFPFIAFFIETGIVLIFSLIAGSCLHAQTITIHNSFLQGFFEDSLLQQRQYHSVFKPYEIPLREFETTFNSRKPTKNHRLFISPVIDAAFGYEKDNNQTLYHFGEGFYMSGLLGKKAGFELTAVLNERKFSNTYMGMLDTLELVPGGNNYLWKSGLQAGYASVRGYLYWKPIRYLTLKTGNDKFFIGDGSRSFFLSENAAAYPFIQTKVNVWNINYVHQVLFLRDLIPGCGSERFSKYASMHTLSYNMTRAFNFYIFEVVVWRAEDSIRQRGFDITYMNPFQFFRPTEFNMGSPDNVLMGFGSKWMFYKQSYIYGQLLLDEFRMQEIRAGKGWWANKYAWQAGIKLFNLAGINKSYLLLEYNYCRPYTYSHSYTLQNYGYLSMPLSHPQGSNFKETVAQFGIAFQKNWFIQASGNYIVYGTDSIGKNLGSDIYKKQWTYAHAYGNTTCQGIKNTDISVNLTLSRFIKPSWRLRAFISGQVLWHNEGGENDFKPGVSFGLNTWL